MKNKRFQSILRQLSPKKRAYADYAQDAEEFCASFNALQSNFPPAQRTFSKFAMVESELFGREYLFCYAKKSWFSQMALGYDALATTSIVFLGVLDSPPVVIVPVGKKFDSPKMRSVLEHEIVHVNQAILGCFPSNFEGGDGDLCQGVLDYTLREYEANFLQLAKWPVLFPKKVHVSLEEWCVLRGYTQALERFISSGLRGNFGERKFLSVFREVESRAANIFVELGASDEIAHKFARGTRRFALQALTHIPQDFSREAGRRFVKFLERAP